MLEVLYIHIYTGCPQKRSIIFPVLLRAFKHHDYTGCIKPYGGKKTSNFLVCLNPLGLEHLSTFFWRHPVDDTTNYCKTRKKKKTGQYSEAVVRIPQLLASLTWPINQQDNWVSRAPVVHTLLNNNLPMQVEL